MCKIKCLLIISLCFITKVAIAEINVAVIELQRIFDESTQAQNIKEKLSAEFLPREKILQGKQAELELKVRDYEKNRTIMSDTERQKTERDIIKMRKDFQVYGQELQKEVQASQKSQMAVVETIIEDAVEKIAKQKGFDLVLYQGIAYHKKALNITDAVLEELKKQNNKIIK